MRQITIAGKEHWMYEGWEEIPIKKATELYEVCKKMPQQLRDRYELMIQKQDAMVKKKIAKIEAEITHKQMIKEFPKFYGDVIQCLSTVPKSVIKKVLPEYRAVVYREYCSMYVIGILFQAYDYDYKKITEFTFNHGDYDKMGRLKKKAAEKKYLFPKSREILEEERPMGHATSIEFAEAADLRIFAKEMEGGLFAKTANIISILCRPEVTKKIKDLTDEEKEYDHVKAAIKEAKGKEVTFIEIYDEQTCLNRAEEFENLKMDVVWEVFFYSIQSFISSSRVTLISSHLQVLELEKQLLAQGLSTTAGTEV